MGVCGDLIIEVPEHQAKAHVLYAIEYKGTLKVVEWESDMWCFLKEGLKRGEMKEGNECDVILS